jgi:hypothetical protein
VTLPGEALRYSDNVVNVKKRWEISPQRSARHVGRCPLQGYPLQVRFSALRATAPRFLPFAFGFVLAFFAAIGANFWAFGADPVVAPAAGAGPGKDTLMRWPS